MKERKKTGLSIQKKRTRSRKIPTSVLVVNKQWRMTKSPLTNMEKVKSAGRSKAVQKNARKTPLSGSSPIFFKEVGEVALR
jgi:hypothetical protein